MVTWLRFLPNIMFMDMPLHILNPLALAAVLAVSHLDKVHNDGVHSAAVQTSLIFIHCY